MTANKKYKLLYKIWVALRCEWKDLLRLSEEQVSYINHYLHHSSFLEACPGSGKTEVIGIKAAYSIYNWRRQVGGIALITFTTSAATELSVRIKRFGNVSAEFYPHYIGTFDSWMYNYIVQPFAHYLTGYAGKDGDKSIHLVDVESSAGFLSNYTTTILVDEKQVPIKATEYYFDHLGQLHGQTQKLDGFLRKHVSEAIKKNLKDKKWKFIQAGFATYSDIELLCTILLKKYPFLQEKIARRFPVILVDECQDLSLGQMNILDSLKKQATCLHFVGDLNQAIYEFRKVNPTDFANYVSKENLHIKRLTNNYRSAQQIVTVAQNIIGGSLNVIGHEVEVVQPACLLWQYDANTFSQLPAKFEQFLITNKIGRNKSVILARGKATLSSLRTQEEKHRFSKSELFAIAFHDWHKPGRTSEDLNHAIFYLGRVLCLLAFNGQGDARKQYCPNAFDAVNWRLFLKGILTASSSIYPYEQNGKDITWTQWVKQLKAFLNSIWSSFPYCQTSWDKVSGKLKAPDGMKDEFVKNSCTRVEQPNKLRTTTIHSVKGQTLDAVLLISHPNKRTDGGHFSQWFRENNYDPEHIRFAYVACSRPKFVLIIATPKLKSAEIIKIEKLGFTITL